MSSGTDAKLIRMANQIATFFETQPGTSQVEDAAKHLHDFWEPRMRDQIFALVDSGAAGDLKPLARQAVDRLREMVAA